MNIEENAGRMNAPQTPVSRQSLIDMSSATSMVALVVTIAGWFTPGSLGSAVYSCGIFALSGAVTNWLAIHMLFEKVPFLYGSGVIPERFEEFKAGIKHLIVSEFFTREHIERFFQGSGAGSLENLTDRIDFDRVFEHLVDAIVDSRMGAMLRMIGGRGALAPLKEPVVDKLKGVVAELAANPGDAAGADLTGALIQQVEHIIDSRLAELTPVKVKTIVEEMIRRHLGWLVLWGGVFGGLIGLVAHLIGR